MRARDESTRAATLPERFQSGNRPADDAAADAWDQERRAWAKANKWTILEIIVASRRAKARQ